ncbi:MAG: hypothetical protein AMXMBFR23_05370 [Chloroflexota bacterium]
MSALVAMEWHKIARRRLNHIVLGVLCAILVLLYVLLWLATGVVEDVGLGGEGMVSELRSSLFLEETVPFALMMLYGFGLMAALVMVGANVGAEYTWNTVRTMTTAEPHRWRWLAAKGIALLGATLFGLLVGLLVVLLTSTVITLIDGRLDLGFVDGPYLRHSAASFGRLLVQIAPYLSLSFMFAVIGRSPTSGIAISIGVMFLEAIVGGMMTLAGGWVAEIPRFGLDYNADSLSMEAGGLFGQMADSAASPFASVMELPDPKVAAAVLLTWAVVFLGIAFWRFQRQDFEYQG